MRLVEDLENKIGREISKYYWDSPTDHADFDKILNAIDNGSGQTCDIAGVMIALHKAGFKIVRIS